MQHLPDRFRDTHILQSVYLRLFHDLKGKNARKLQNSKAVTCAGKVPCCFVICMCSESLLSEDHPFRNAKAALAPEPEHHTLKHDEETKHCTIGHLLPPGFIQRAQTDNLLNRRQDHHPKEGADDIAHASCEQRPTDNGCRNRIHFSAHGNTCVAGRLMHDEHKPGQPTEKAADHIAEKTRTLHIDAQHQCTLLVSA